MARTKKTAEPIQSAAPTIDQDNFRSWAAEKLRDFGLEVAAADILADGEIHRVDAQGYPGEQSAGYIAYLDGDANVTMWDWRRDNGDKSTVFYHGDNFKALSKKEREARKARLKEIRELHDKEKRETEERTAAKAKEIWDNAAPAPKDFPYLVRKGLPAEGWRVSGGQLVVPISDGKQIWSLQFIKPEKHKGERDKTFLPGGKLRGCYCRIAGDDTGTDNPLLLCEGAATGQSLCVCTGCEVWAAMSGWNLKEVAKLAKKQFPDRPILICGDNDLFDQGGNERTDPAGAKYAERAAAAANVPFVICPLVNGKNADFDDLRRAGGVEAVQSVIDAALQEAEACPMPKGFYMVKEGPGAGLYAGDGGAGDAVYLGPPLQVLGFSRDNENSDWGITLQWNDADAKVHTWTMPVSELKRKYGDWEERLATQGWLSAWNVRDQLHEFFSNLKPRRRVRSVRKIGWYKSAYVLPDRTFGQADGDIVVVRGADYSGLYGTAGTLDGWREIPKLAVGNRRFVFALCAAFAGFLMQIGGIDGGGFSFEGKSSTGKTILLRAAASVVGGPSHVRSWRSTDNGLEGACALANDNVLIVDEVGQVSPNVLNQCTYMIANGRAKARANRRGDLRNPLEWLVLFLSSGEIGLSAKLAEAGLHARAGQEVRFCGITVAEDMIENLHGLESRRDLVNRIRDLSATHYGHAGRAYLEWLTDPDHFKDVSETVRPYLDNAVETLCPTAASGQVQRVARRFGLVAFAGKLAQQADLLPQDMDVEGAVQDAFDDWLTNRGGAGDAEIRAIVEQVTRILEKDGSARFQPVNAEDDGRYRDRLGFAEQSGANGAYTFYVTVQQFKMDLVKGFSPRLAVTALERAGILHRGPDRPTVTKRLPGLGSTRCYMLSLPNAVDGGAE